MNFERTIQIGAHNIKVVEISDNILAVDNAVIGTWWMTKNSIALAKELPESRKVEVLLHEITHALVHQARLSPDLEEVVVTVLAENLASFMRSNPDLIVDMLNTFGRQENELANGPDAEPKPKSRRKSPGKSARSRK